jgi:G:T-mismatch repair DNA endonuclease (very short patch repair protein)
MTETKDFKILFFNRDNKQRFILKQFKENPSDVKEFKQILIAFGGFNTNNEMFLNSFYKKYLTLFKKHKLKSQDEFSTYFFRTKCLDIEYKSSTDEYFKSRGWSDTEMKQIRSEKYATGTIEFQAKKHGISKEAAKSKITETQTQIKLKRKETYKKLVEENPNYWKESVGYGIDSLMKNKNISREEATILYEKISNNVSTKNKDWAKYQKENNTEHWNSRLESQRGYWLKKGYNEDEIDVIINERQNTFTLDKCILKHGKSKGTAVYNNRQEKWLIKLYANFEMFGDGRSRQSKWANSIKEILKPNGIQIHEKEKWIREEGTNSKAYSYDLTVNKKIIEFNGDYWHMNPSKYKSSSYNKTKKMLASDIWQYDANKIKLAESHGYEVLTIWESDYNRYPTVTIQKCIEFLKG